MNSKFKLAKIALSTEVQFIRVIFCVLFLSLIIGFFKINVCMYEKTAKKTKHIFFLKDSIEKSGIVNIPDSSPQIIELKNRFNQIQILKQSYLNFSVNAYSVWYASTHLFLITSILFGIATFLIAKQGWDNIKNFYLKASFLILFLATSYFGLIPTVFNNKEVGQENTNKFFNFESVQIDIIELLKNKKSMLLYNKFSNLDTAILQIDSRIKAINNINFDIYNDKVPKSYKVMTTE